MDVAVGIVAQRDNERAQALAASLVDARARGSQRRRRRRDRRSGRDECRPGRRDGRSRSRREHRRRRNAAVRRARSRFDADPGNQPREVGFLNAVAPDDALGVVTELAAELDETGSVEERELARLRATGVEADWTLEPALNEIVVHGPRRGSGGGATVGIDIDGQRYAESHADGVLVATPTGSTAYNLSEGGPLVHPSAETLVVAQMAATEPMPPLVVEPETEITLTVSETETAYAISDGRNRQRLDPPAEVSVSLANDAVRLVGPQANFFDGLDKLE